LSSGFGLVIAQRDGAVKSAVGGFEKREDEQIAFATNGGPDGYKRWLLDFCTVAGGWYFGTIIHYESR
jgi:hypothetical protein